MEQDKVFNLQLTIQKLQEEVSLYRNGANGEELLQLIAEKESEIRALKASAVIKNENLRNLAKKSAEVLARCDRVQSEYDTLQFEHSDLIQEKKRLDAEVTGLQKLRSLSVAECDGKTITINLLEEEVATREESIDKLQARCATLISQQNERNKAYDAEVRDLVADRSSKIGNIKELTDELERAMRYNTEMKGRLNREHANSLDLSSKLQRCKIDLQTMTQANEDLQIAGERQKMEFSALSSAKELVEADLAESMRLFTTGKSTADASESQLRSMLAGRDIEICELIQSLKAITESAAADMRKVKEEARKEVMIMRAEADTTAKIVRKLEAERDSNLFLQKDFDTLKLKNEELQEKIKRQDQYMKSRLLKDKTNFNSTSLCTPEPSDPIYRPPSARAIADAASASSLVGPTAEIRSSGPTAKCIR